MTDQNLIKAAISWSRILVQSVARATLTFNIARLTQAV